MFYFDNRCIDKALVAINKTLNDFSDDYNILISLSHQPCPVKDGKQFICYKIREHENDFINADPYWNPEKEIYISLLNRRPILTEKQELVADILRNYDWESAGVTGFEEANLSWEEECKAMGYGTAAERDNHFISMDEFNSMVKVIKEKDRHRAIMSGIISCTLFILTMLGCMYVFYLLENVL
jgi:hypothetical protein